MPRKPTAHQEPAQTDATVTSGQVVEAEKQDLWRRRLRLQLPFVNERLLCVDPYFAALDGVQKAWVLSWLDDALSIADAIVFAAPSTDGLPREAADKALNDIQSYATRCLDTLPADNSSAEPDPVTSKLAPPDPASFRFAAVMEVKTALAQLASWTRSDLQTHVLAPPVAGLALSGGGIRSASYNLGVLEALKDYGVLDKMDYLSTVSGGGYIGAAWTHYANADRQPYPFGGTQPPRNHSRINWMRAHGSYLNTGREVNSMTLVAALFRGIFINLLLIVPPVFLVLFGLTATCNRKNGALCCSLDGSVLATPLGVFATVLTSIFVMFMFRYMKGRKIPQQFRVRVQLLFLLAMLAAVPTILISKPADQSYIAFLAALWASLPALSAVLLTKPADQSASSLLALLLAIGPMLLLVAINFMGLLLSNQQSPMQNRALRRIPYWATETAAWAMVAGLVFLLLSANPPGSKYPIGHLALLLIGLALTLKVLVNFVLMTAFSASATRFKPAELRTFFVQYGDFLVAAMALGFFGALPYLDQLIQSGWDTYGHKALSGLTVGGVISTAAGWLQRGKGKENQGYVALLLRVGVSALLAAGLIWMYRLALSAHSTGGTWSWNYDSYALIAVGLTWIFLCIVADINYMSMHSYYRNRLADAFLTDPAEENIYEAVRRRSMTVTGEAAVYLSQKSAQEVEKVVSTMARGDTSVDEQGSQAANKRHKPSAFMKFLSTIFLLDQTQITLADAMTILEDPAFLWCRAKADANDKPIAADGLAIMAARVDHKDRPDVLVFDAFEGQAPVVDERRMAAALDAAMAATSAPATGRGADTSRWRTHDSTLPLQCVDVGKSGAPYHLINTNLVLAGSRSEKYRVRRGDSFVLSPRYAGSDATGWVSMENERYAGINIGTAMAVSGAAVDPNTGVTMSTPLRIVMSLLNVRLGYWWPRPGDTMGVLRRYFEESWPVLIVREMFAMMHENTPLVRLSDGGHFENLGIYELARRRCKLIVIGDAAADPKFRFSDLARAIERIRVDFGVRIAIDTKTLRPDPETACSRAPFAVGTIYYPETEEGLAATTGQLVLVKSTLFEGLCSEDVLGYKRAHREFPDETTADQFFSEEQFEAYRELGFMAGLATCKGLNWPDDGSPIL